MTDLTDALSGLLHFPHALLLIVAREVKGAVPAGYTRRRLHTSRPRHRSHTRAHRRGDPAFARLTLTEGVTGERRSPLHGLPHDDKKRCRGGIVSSSCNDH